MPEGSKFTTWQLVCENCLKQQNLTSRGAKMQSSSPGREILTLWLAVQPKVLIFDDLGMRLNNQVFFSRKLHFVA